MEASRCGEQVPGEHPRALCGGRRAGHGQQVVAGRCRQFGGPVGEDQPLECVQRAGDRVGGATSGTSAARLARGGGALGRDTGLMGDGYGQQRRTSAAARSGPAKDGGLGHVTWGLSGWR